MSLEDFAADHTTKRPGYTAAMDKISAEHQAEAIEGYHRGITGPTIRAWLQSIYPEIRFTAANCDLWLSKHHPRFTRG